MDGSVRIWSLKTGQNLHTLTGHSSLVGLLSLSPSTLVSAAADSTLRIWDPDTGAPLHVLQAHQGAITCFQHDEFKVLSGSDGALKMWDTRDGTVMRDLLTNIMGVWQVVFDERFCVAASNLQEHTYLDVWDFGEDGDADIDAARIIEDDDESEDEDDPSGIDEDEDEDEDALMVDASATSSRRMEVTPTPHERGGSEDGPLGGPGPSSWRDWIPNGRSGSEASSSNFVARQLAASASPQYAPSPPSYGPSSPSFSPGQVLEDRQYFGRDEAYGAGPSTSSSKRSIFSPNHPVSGLPSQLRADVKGKGRAQPSASPVPTQSRVHPQVVDTTPPASSIGPVAPPNPHSASWTPSAYTLQAAQMGEDTPTKPHPRRQGR